MKKLITILIALCCCNAIMAQQQIKDETAITSQIDAMLYSWNHHNYDDLKNYTTENTDWVNGVGMWWKGRKASQYAHQVYHNGMFKESVVEKQSVHIRFITKDVAIAHLFWHFSAFTDPGGNKRGPDDCLATLVYVNEKGKWLMTAGENIAIVKEVQQDDPVKQMPSQ